jgi:hypothetical protein
MFTVTYISSNHDKVSLLTSAVVETIVIKVVLFAHTIYLNWTFWLIRPCIKRLWREVIAQAQVGHA